MRELIPLMLIIVALENILRGGVGLYKSLILEDALWGSITDSWTCNLGCIFYFNKR